MTVATPILPNFAVQQPSGYKASLDAAFAATRRLSWGFAPRADVSFAFSPAEVDSAADRIKFGGHTLINNDRVRLTTTGTLPSPLVPGTDYYVVGRTEDDFQLAASQGGAALDLTSGGTGTHTLAKQADMVIGVMAGFLYNLKGTLTEVAAQRSPSPTAPATNPRIDRFVLNRSTGAVEHVQGTEAASPTPPAIPVGKIPICQAKLTVGMTGFTNAMLTDERPFGLILPVRRGALLKRTADQSIATNTLTFISWQAAVYDDLGFWAASPNPTRITVPSGVTKIRYWLQFEMDGISGGVFDSFHGKNGGGPIQFAGGGVSLAPAPSGNLTIAGYRSGILDVVAGDFFEFQVRHFSGAAKNLKAVNETYLQVEVVE